MLTDAELDALFVARHTPPEGVARIRLIREGLPSRATRSNKVSGKTRYAPLKMPFVVEAEAVSTEYVALVECDHDEDVLEFYSQVEPLHIEYLATGTARRTRILTTPDIFKITREGFVFVECKTEKELESLAAKYPSRFHRDERNRWRSPPAERAAAELGCCFEVRSSKQNNWTLHENLEFLKDYAYGVELVVEETIRSNVAARLKESGWVSAFDLVHVEPSIPADAVYALIVSRDVYFPLDAMRLVEQERALVFRDEITYRAHKCFVAARVDAPLAEVCIATRPGSVFTWDGNPWRIINASLLEITVQALAGDGSAAHLAHISREDFESLVRQGKIVGAAAETGDAAFAAAQICFQNASEKDLKEGAQRFRKLQAFWGKEADAGTPSRTLYHWQRCYREAEARYGNGFVGLLPRRSGNRCPKVSEATLKLLEEVISSDWETIRRKSYLASYGKYLAFAKVGGLTPVSYVTFWKRANARAGHLQLAKREGEKAAYRDEPQYMELDYTTPTHGVRPWHIAHIDHTPLPLKFVANGFLEELGSVWLSLFSDANARKVLAYYLTFDKPSYRSCMMVLRDCVRRHNRVPQIIVCDQGSEFNGEYWETQLALLRCTKRERRAGRPREGSVCERLFRTTQSQFITNLLGATDLLEQHFRSISPEVRPEHHAVWTLERFDSGFQRYLDEVFHCNHHSGIGMSPDDAWALGMRSSGNRAHTAIPYDEVFIAQSCPAVHRGTARVTPAGIKVRGRWFKCDAFTRPGVQDSSVHARYDPFNAGVAYAYVEAQWHRCFSQFYPAYAGRSEKEVWLATERLRLTDRLSGRQASISAERLAVHLMTSDAEELALQQGRDQESEAHRERISSASGLRSLPPSSSFPMELGQTDVRPTLVPQPLEDL